MRFVYVILVIAALIFYPLFTGDLSFFLLVTVILLPVASYVILCVYKNGIKASYSKTAICEKGQPYKLAFTVENDSFLPCPLVIIALKVKYLTTGESENIKLRLSVARKSKEVANIDIISEHSGKVQINVQTIRAFDMLRLFFKNIAIAHDEISVYFIPQRAFASDIAEKESEVSTVISAEKSADKAGSDNPDIFGIREYKEGDRISLIHHKISSRFQKDYVRIFSQDENNKVLIIPDFSDVFEDGKIVLDKYDDVIMESALLAQLASNDSTDVYIYLREAPSDFEYSAILGGYIYKVDNGDSYVNSAAIVSGDVITEYSATVPNTPSGFMGIIAKGKIAK